jgi:hypothetical protein
MPPLSESRLRTGLVGRRFETALRDLFVRLFFAAFTFRAGFFLIPTPSNVSPMNGFGFGLDLVPFCPNAVFAETNAIPATANINRILLIISLPLFHTEIGRHRNAFLPV